MKIGHGEYEVDLLDYVFIEKYEDAYKKLEEYYIAIENNKDSSVSVTIREYINGICDFFDAIFGENAGNTILGTETSLMAVLGILEEFKAGVNQSVKKVEKLKTRVKG